MAGKMQTTLFHHGGMSTRAESDGPWHLEVTGQADPVGRSGARWLTKNDANAPCVHAPWVARWCQFSAKCPLNSAFNQADYPRARWTPQ